MQSTRIAHSFIIIAGVIALLVLGQDLLIPLIIAVFVWYVIATLAEVLDKIRIGKFRLPNWLRLTLSTVIILGVCAGAIEIVVNSVEQMSEAFGVTGPEVQVLETGNDGETTLVDTNLASAASADSSTTDSVSVYQENFDALVSQVLEWTGQEEVPSFAQVLESIDLSTIAGEISSNFASFLGNLFLVLIYTLFLIVEQGAFSRKLLLLFPDADDEARYRDALDRINKSIKTYISVKTLVSVMTGVVSFLIMWAVGLDFAIFWAFLIFLLNYIPTIGSLIATVFPATFALLQFDGWGPFAIIFLGIGAVQVVVGNVVEPKLMGNSLNISGLVMLLSLALWGALWGVVGMVFSVPIMVILMIFLAEFEGTRWVAIMLSANGNVGQKEWSKGIGESENRTRNVRDFSSDNDTRDRITRDPEKK